MMSFDPQTLAERSRRLKHHAEKIQRDQRRNAAIAATNAARPALTLWMKVKVFVALCAFAALGLFGLIFAFGFLFGLFLQ
jgi:hypothetical protein